MRVRVPQDNLLSSDKELMNFLRELSRGENVSFGAVSVASESAMVSYPSAALVSDITLFWVASYGDYFRLTDGGLTARAAEVINLADGRQAVRLGIQNRAWQAQATWSIDESNVTGLASDENTGLTDAVPLLTIGEFMRRIGPTFKARIIVTVRWLSNATTTFVDMGSIHSDDATAAVGYVAFHGVPIVVQSGTLTAGSAAGAGDVAPVVEDTAIPSTWAAGGGISTSTGGRLIRKTTGDVRAWVSKELGAQQARTSWGSSCPEVVTSAAYDPGAAAFAAGDAYEVVSLPSFPGIKAPSPSLFALRFLLLHLTGGSLTQIRTNSTLFVWCSFGGLASVFGAEAGGTFNCCCFMGGLAATGSVFCRWALFGSGTQLASFGADWNTFTNTIQGGTFTIAHGSNLNLSGTFHVYDSAGAITLSTVSRVTLQNIHGSGNTGIIVNVLESNCFASTRGVGYATWTATTTAPNPVSLVGVGFAYAALPQVDLVNMSWIN